MNLRLIGGSLAAHGYNHWVGRVPVGACRQAYLRLWLGRLGGGTGVQMGCRFLNGRKVFLGERNVVNFGCLFDGRRFRIETGDDVSIGRDAAITSDSPMPAPASTRTGS